MLLLVQGTGMANIMAPATASILSTLPRERAGSGSSVNNTARQVGGALGVAVLSSVLSASYRAHVAGALRSLPPAARAAGAESIGGLQAVAERLPVGARGPLLSAARGAFIDAMHATALGSALVALLGTVVVAIWLPGRPATPTYTDPAVAQPVAA